MKVIDLKDIPQTRIIYYWSLITQSLMFRIFVKTIVGGYLIFDCSPDETVAVLRRKTMFACNFNLCDVYVRLIFMAKDLDDKMTLKEAELYNECSITITLRLKGPSLEQKELFKLLGGDTNFFFK